jgi:hypothetical protein
VGADIGKCPFDLSTVKHGFFLYIIILRRPTKTAAVNLHTGHADVPSGFQQGMPTAQKRQQGVAESGAKRNPGRQIGGCLRESPWHVKDASKLLFLQ